MAPAHDEERPGPHTGAPSVPSTIPSRKATSMETLHQPPVSDPEPPPATPYFLRRATFAAEVRAEVARRS